MGITATTGLSKSEHNLGGTFTLMIQLQSQELLGLLQLKMDHEC